MEDDVSSTITSSQPLDILPIQSDEYQDDEVDIEALQREKQIGEHLENAFDDLSDDEDDDDDDDDDTSQSSEEESVNSSHQKSQSYADHPSVEESFESEEKALTPINSNLLSLVSHVEPPEEHSQISESEYLPHSDENHSNNFVDHRIAGTHWSNGDLSELNSDIITNGQHVEPSEKSAKRSIESLPSCPDRYQINSSVSSEHVPPSKSEEYMQLQVLFRRKGQELEQMKKEELKRRQIYDQEIRSLKSKLAVIEGEKERLFFSLKESKELLSQSKNENIILKGNLASIERQFSAEKEAKENVQSELQSAQVTIHSLEQQIKRLTQSENAIRLRDQSESIIKDLKLRHQKEVLQLREEIDKLRENLNSKTNELESMLVKFSQLQRKYEDLQVEKSENFNKLSASLEASQKQCRKLLESDSISELSKLKLQFQHLQEEKSKLEKQNSALKDEVRSLKSELQTFEALKVDNEESVKADSDKKRQSSHKDSSLKSNLQQSLKSIQSLRNENSSLKERLEELIRKLAISEENAKLLQSRFKESQAKAKDLEKKLEELLPTGSIPLVEHEKKVNVLEKELRKLKSEFHDVSERLKCSSANEEKLYENNKDLKSKIKDLVTSHASEKISAVESCREKYMEIHESAINKLKEELTSNANSERKVVCGNYEHKIAKLQQEIKHLNDCLTDARQQCVKVFEENKLLQSKIDSMLKPKGYEEMEKEIKSQYENKLSKNKEMLEHIKEQYESRLQSEIESFKKMWTQQRMADIQKFVNTTKQQLDEEFVKCVEKEKSHCQAEIKAEAEKFRMECDQKIRQMKEQCEAEKDNLNAQLRESFQLKWRNEIKELQQDHQKEVETIRQKYQVKISTMEAEMRILKENLSKKCGESEDAKNVKQDFLNEKLAWEKEKMEFMNKELIIDKKLTSALENEKKVLEKVKKYHKYISSLKKHYQGKMRELQAESEKLKVTIADKQNDILVLKQQHEQMILQADVTRKKQANSRNSESQTEEKFVSQKTLHKVQDMFIQCLRKIAEDTKTYLMNSRKRCAEQLNKALSFYHDHLISKIYQDVLKDANAYGHGISSRDHFISPNTMQQQLNSNFKISNSSQVHTLAAGDTNLNNVNMFPNTRSTPESGIRFEDVSFDFVPLRMPDSAFTSTKMPEYHVPGGLFNQQNIFPERESPLSIIK